MTNKRTFAALTILALVLLAGCGTTVITRTTTEQLHVQPRVGVVVTPKAPVAELPTATSCGRERWNVKTLTDPGASSVNLTPTPTTIDQLVQTPPSPDPYGPDMVRQPAEKQTYVVHGTLILAKTESDSDFHLVLQDADGKTLVAEIPDPACATGSVALQQITQARSDFIRMFGDPSGGIRPGQPVTVAGALFYDKDHGQTGRADIGSGEDVELHPVTSITSP